MLTVRADNTTISDSSTDLDGAGIGVCRGMRAGALNRQVMLFDELTRALDPELIGEVLGVMRAWLKKA